MKSLLPYVEESSYDILNEELDLIPEEGYHTYLEDLLFVVMENNKVIADHLSDLLPDLKYDKSQLEIAEKSLLIYHLLDFEAMSENIELPKVSKKTLGSMKTDFLRWGSSDYIKSKIKGLEKNNPLIYWYYLRVPTNVEEIDKGIYIGLNVYKLLERQAEAELMEKKFGKVF